jgi:predicted TPR repeat methyltransferase
MTEEAGRPAEAEAAWREALRLDPEDRMGAALKLGLAGVVAAGLVPSPAFVETLFDQYAADFDAALVGKLHYRVPELIHTALLGLGHTRFAHALDLGCGTGLMGERLRRMTSFLEGIDLSAAMLRQAEAKRLYDRLEKGDLNALAPAPAAADLVTAADVLIYVGPLERPLAAIAGRLKAGGLLAFSVERHDGAGPMALCPSRRYAHSPAYVEASLKAAGFETVARVEAELRQDRGAPVPGLIVVARLAAAPEAAAAIPPEAAEEPAPALPLRH